MVETHPGEPWRFSVRECQEEAGNRCGLWWARLGEESKEAAPYSGLELSASGGSSVNGYLNRSSLCGGLIRERRTLT